MQDINIPIVVGLNAVVVAVSDEIPRMLTVKLPSNEKEAQIAPSRDGIPFGPLDPVSDRTLELGLRRWVTEQTGLQLGYLEQLYTFADRDRVKARGERTLSVAYLALTRHIPVEGSGSPRWSDWYDYFPWEDWRDGRPESIDGRIVPGLQEWIANGTSAIVCQRRRERAEICFGLGGAPWDRNRVLDRYELLYEACLVVESWSDIGRTPSSLDEGLGRPMALDHRRIAATAFERLRGKLSYRPVAFELLPEGFTLLRLQRVVEALAGEHLHKQNFRRLVEQSRLVERTGQIDPRTGGRPAELFRFRREVLRERPAPGVGLPRRRLGGI